MAFRSSPVTADLLSTINHHERFAPGRIGLYLAGFGFQFAPIETPLFEGRLERALVR